MILNGLNLSVNAGEVHAIMGPNGSGKSTLAYVLAGRPEYEVTAGDILLDGESLLELEPELRLCVLGANHRASGPRKLHLDHHVGSVIRALQRPVLVATSEHFAPPERFVVAYDASPTARKMVDMVAASPLLRGLPALIAMVGADTTEAQEQLAAAAELLRVAGFSVQTRLLAGEPEQALPELLASQGAALLVMGAYGHSRIRQLIVGSTTTTLLRLSEVPVLILR